MIAASAWRARFDRHARLLTATLFAIGLLIPLAATELGLRWYGVDRPLLYETNPVWGFRPKANQTVRRYDGNVVHTNNLGLRANADWDSVVANKVLFLGNSVTFGSSYVSNDDLFSERVTRGDPRWVAGNAGVNGWGVDNIYGLIVTSRFHPARVYISVLIEDDFYRGLARKSTLLREANPVLAIQAAIPTVAARIRRRANRGDTLDAASLDRLAREAVGRLASLDSAIRRSGAIHLIYLSPYLSNLNDAQPPDARLRDRLAEARIAVARIADRRRLRSMSAAERKALFHDDVHLNKAGHLVWSDIIKPDLDSALAADSSRRTVAVDR